MKTSGGQHTRASLDRTFESVPTNPSTNSSPAKPAEPTGRPTPLSHEAETSGSARRLGEPPTQHNPRAEVPFAKAKSPITKTQKSDAASRTKKATDRARRLGFQPTRAPEAFTNPNGTGKPTTHASVGAPRSGPTVPFDEEVERFRVARLRRKMERDEDKRDDDDDEEAFEEPVASDSPRRIHVLDEDDEDDAYEDDVDPFGSGVRARDAEDPIQAVRDARIEVRANRALRAAAARTGDKNRVGWSDGWMAGTSTADVRARQHELMAAQEAIKRQFGSQTEGGNAGSPGSADAAPVSPEPASRRTLAAVRRGRRRRGEHDAGREQGGRRGDGEDPARSPDADAARVQAGFKIRIRRRVVGSRRPGEDARVVVVSTRARRFVFAVGHAAAHEGSPELQAQRLDDQDGERHVSVPLLRPRGARVDDVRGDARRADGGVCGPRRSKVDRGGERFARDRYRHPGQARA